MSVTEQLPMAAQKVRRSRRLVSLTFDDGFAPLYQTALPVLVRYSLPATVFVVVGMLEDAERVIDWLPDPPPFALRVLNREEVREMDEAGVHFGSHSWAHYDLRRLSEEECLRDLRHSREALEDLLRKPVPLLAYPYGFHAAHVRRAAKKAGFKFAFSLPPGPEAVDRFAVPRVGIYGHNGLNTLKTKTSAAYLPLRMSRVGEAVARLREAVDSRRGSEE